MVDIHCHILPSLDDGAKEESISMEMARMAVADGITHVVATPHSNYRYKFDPEVNRRKRDELQKRIGPSPELLLGCDFHLSYENIEDAKRNPAKYTINGLQYLLVEFADNGIPPTIDQIFFGMQSQGITPIVTHPERNPILARDIRMVQKWVDSGVLVQITAASFTGRFGKVAEKASLAMLRHNMVHFIASDAHDHVNRPLQLSAARKVVAQDRGEEVAEALSEKNPRAAIEGNELAWMPSPIPYKERKWFSLFR